MQEVYGLDVSDLDTADDAHGLRIATLCMQLPGNARVRLLDEPDAAWDDSTHFLRAVDFRLQAIIRMLAGKGPKPKPAQTPGEAAKMKQMADSAAENRSMVDEILGL